MAYGTSSTEDRNFSEFIGNFVNLESVLDYIKSNFSPHQVFDKQELEDWARDNDFNHIDDKP